MKKISVDKIRKLRDKTGAPIMRVKQVLEEFEGDPQKTFKLLQKEGFEKAAKRAQRLTNQGVVATYLHHNKKVAAVVELLCETDFVARNKLFGKLADDLAQQIAAMDPKDATDLAKQEFIKDPKKKIADLVKTAIAKTGENIRIGRFYRIELGKK